MPSFLQFLEVFPFEMLLFCTAFALLDVTTVQKLELAEFIEIISNVLQEIAVACTHIIGEKFGFHFMCMFRNLANNLA